jgi:hypothetical protein
MKLVGYGRGATVSGWLGEPNGIALGGQTVHVMTAPARGSWPFTEAATTTTAANGNWSASLPGGPSRLVEAVYDGTSTLEPATSAPVNLLVPASLRVLRVWPRRVRWGGTVRLRLRLLGRYQPVGGVNVRLRYGVGSAYTTYGVRERARGVFTVSASPGAGPPSVIQPFWFQECVLPDSGYPYEPSCGRKVTVLVGG